MEMEAEDSGDDLILMLGKNDDDLVHAHTHKVEVKEEDDASDDDEQDLFVPLVDPLSPSSDLVPTTHRYETRKRHLEPVLYEGSDSDNSDGGSDWEPEEVEEPQPKVKTSPKNVKKIKIIKIEVEDGLDWSDQGEAGETRSGEHTKIRRRQRRQKKQNSATNTSEAQISRQGELNEPSETGIDNEHGGTDALEETSSQQPGNVVQPKRRRQKRRSSRPITEEEEERVARVARQREYRRKYRRKLKSLRSSRPITEEERLARVERQREYRRKHRRKLKALRLEKVEAGKEEDKVKPRRRQRPQAHAYIEGMEAGKEEQVKPRRSRQRAKTYIERYEAQLEKRREYRRRFYARMTPEQRAERSRKTAMRKKVRNASMTEEQRREERQKNYLCRVTRETKMSAEELEAMKERARARSRAYRLEMMATEEERREYLERRRQQRIDKNRANVKRTPEEKERYRQLQSLYRRRYELRQKLARAGLPPEQIEEQVKDFQANFVPKPPPLVRPRTLIRYPNSWVPPGLTGRWLDRFIDARNYARRKLTAAGVPPEEMEAKFKELQAKYEKLAGLYVKGERYPLKLRPNETQEEGEARIMKARLAVVKCKLRKQLSARGAPPEEIEEKLRELAAKYEAKAKTEITFRPYKPRAKQKRWLRSESEVGTSEPPQDAAAAVVSSRTETQSRSPPSPNSYCEPEPDHPDDCNSPPPLPDPSSPPQMFGGAIDMSHHQQIQIRQKLMGAHSNEPFKFSLGNGTRGGPTMVTPPLDLMSLKSKPTAPSQEEGPLPSPPEPTLKSVRATLSSPPPDADFFEDDWVEEEENNSDQQEEEFVAPPPQPKIPRRSSPSSGSAAKRRPGRKSGPRGTYGAAKGPLVTCDLCGNNYSAGSMFSHMRVTHNPNWVDGKCVACGMEFSVGAKFLKHYNHAHVYPDRPKGKNLSKQRFGPRRRKLRTAEEEEALKSKLVVCKLCGLSFRQSEIEKHKGVEHHPAYKEGKCTLCNAAFGGAVGFYQHWQSEHGQTKKGWVRRKDWICSECGDGFASPHYLSQHEYLVHGEGSKEENFPQCPFCGNKYRSDVILDQHLKNVHPEESGLELRRRPGCLCRRCGEKCGTNKKLLGHVSALHPDAYFPCPHCEHLMYTEQSLNYHVLLCSRIVNRKRGEDRGGGGEEVDTHFAKTLACLLLPCEFCAKEMRISSLRQHYRVVHGVIEKEPWTCSLCSQTFSSRVFWLNHLDGRHGIPLDDEVKEQARKLHFSDRSQLKVKNPQGIVKRRVMNGKKVARRRKSGSSSSEDDEDSRPSWVIRASIPLPCELCSKEMRLSSLKLHYKMMHGVVEEDWTCIHCSQTFSQRETWLNHLFRKHGIPLDGELKEQSSKMNVSDRSQVEVKNLTVFKRRRICKSKKSRSSQDSEESYSEDEEDKELNETDEDEFSKSSDDDEDAQRNNAGEVDVGHLRRSTIRSCRHPRSKIKREIPQVETEKRLMISVVRLDEKEISKWVNRSNRMVSEL